MAGQIIIQHVAKTQVKDFCNFMQLTVFRLMTNGFLHLNVFNELRKIPVAKLGTYIGTAKK